MRTDDTHSSSTSQERVAVIGDVGGHLDVFTASLVAAGVDPRTWLLPMGLSVVQVGDLVHKGPDSAGCVALAEVLLRRNPGRYVQLLGNHEGHYLGGPDVSGRAGVADVGDATAAVLRRWWADGQGRLAVSVERPDGTGVLLTHGGLTAGLWRDLGAPATAWEAAGAIAAQRNPGVAFRPGWLMTGSVDFRAGVTNPRTGAELAASWLLEGALAFDQVHGHEGVWAWPLNDWHDDVPDEVRALSVVDRERRFCSVRIGARTLTSVDWVLGTVAPKRQWLPLLLPGRVRLG